MSKLRSLVGILALVAVSLAALVQPAKACWECQYGGDGNVYSQCAWWYWGGSSCVDTGNSNGPWMCSVSGSCSWGWIDPDAFRAPRLTPVSYSEDDNVLRVIEVCLNSPGCWYRTDDATETRALRRITEPWGRTTILYRS